MSFRSSLNRRQALRTIGGGFGMLGLASVISSALGEAAPQVMHSALDVRPTHFPAKAKHVIFLFMNGGISQVDTFDPKPMLTKYDGQPMPGGSFMTEAKTGNLMRSPFSFKRYGQSGIEVSEIFPKIGESIDDICVVRSVQTEVPNHEPSLFMMNCGQIQPGRPSMGAWLTYGLGTENQNLPGFVVLCPDMPNVVGPPLWNSAFLPAIYQGTYVSTKEKDPRKLIQFLNNSEMDATTQRRELDLVNQLNRIHIERQEDADPQLEARIESMEIAYHMQTEAPQVFDVSKESQKTQERYGSSDFGRGCLMALRLVQKGVRSVQVYFDKGNPWDHHEDIQVHRKLADQCDQPIAALIQDLKARGLFEETIVFVASEFGRTPVNQTSGNIKLQAGRDHNHLAFSVLIAGGGFKGGLAYGQSDDFGFRAIENKVHVHDLHATILHQMGIDHERLTYRYSGRDFRLTDVAGRVVTDILV
ncbi:MAG: DUF1501 domain-containing protein [Bryobacteraceae bacterium]